ncbi:AAA family ATPase [Nocardia flavorosea]|uniref:ATP-binding protein n=1 Tax=Nocardia flavorosea TaxID=53429 RepID=A0A846YLI2_9NOCA|nr:AAA family ATPase [Nocardia flavorosea]NKY59987.1 ATP-binding protein [Nocardia flavorosea]
MLRSFRVSNHKSLADLQELRLTRGSASVAVPVTAVHGGPAAGKSNLVDALGHMREAVLRSVTGWDPYAGPERAPHLGHTGQPSEFEAVFIAEETPYTYGFRLDAADVAAEWLYSHPRSRKRIVFEREGETVRVGPMFEAARFGITALIPLVRPNALLLSLAGQMYAEALVPAYRWFETRFEVSRGTGAIDSVELRVGAHLSRSTENAARLLTLLQTADLGITDLLIAQNDPGYADYLRDLDADIAALGEQTDRAAGSAAYAAQLESDSGLTAAQLARELTNMRNARDALYTRMVARRGVGLRLVHIGVDPVFTLAEESSATVALLRLLPVLLDALDAGKVLVVDDIGARLTVEEADRLIQLFQNPETNTRGAQLVYTTGDRALVDRGNGRSARTRTGTWTVRRSDAGTSTLAMS